MKNTVDKGREFESFSEMLLMFFFKKITPLYTKKRKIDFEVINKKGETKTVECKSTSYNSGAITLAQKDLGADYVLIKIGDNIYFYEKIRLWKLEGNRLIEGNVVLDLFNQSEKQNEIQML